MYNLTASAQTVVRKVYLNNTQPWISSVNSIPIAKSLTIDATDQNVYFGISKNPLDVLMLSSNNGAINSAQRFYNLDGSSDDIKIHLMSTGYGYYITGKDGSNKANI